MKLANLFPLSKEQRQTLIHNYQILRQEVDKIGKEYEQKSYEELLSKNEPTILTVTTAAGFKLTFVAEAYHLQKNGALPGLVGKMYSKIQSWGSEWNEPQRHKGHKDRSLLDKQKLSHKVEKSQNGTICFCIDADGLPTLFCIKPSYNFYKRSDDSVYY